MKQLKLWTVALFPLFLIAGCAAGNKNGNPANHENIGNETADGAPVITPVAELDPDNPMTNAIQYGEEIFKDTNTVMADYVGNELSCQSSYADGGLSKSSSIVGVVADYPQYRPREGIVFTLEDRINSCMIRSMNGEMIQMIVKECAISLLTSTIFPKELKLVRISLGLR